MAKLRSKNRAYNRLATTVSASAYAYGWPTAGSSEPNVVAQWLFDEASGNIVDEVASLSLAKNQSGAGASILYAQTNSDYSNSLNPGIYMKSVTGSTDSFYAADTSLVIGTASAVLEWVASYGVANAMGADDATVFNTTNNSVEHGIYVLYTNMLTTPRMNLYFKASDGTGINSFISLTASIFNTGTHKHRLVLNRAGNAEYFVDGVSQGTASLGTLSGKTLECSQVNLGSVLSSGVNSLESTFYEFRLTIGNATNNSGGPGGG